MVENPALTVSVLLTLAVLVVTGWTAAPNAIAGAVVTGALSFRRAVALAAVCNFLGVLCVTAVYPSVVETIYSIAAFGGGPRAVSLALCAAMGAVVLWAAVVWWWGIPTSESHALIAGLTGSAIALHGSLAGVNGSEWVKVIYGLVISVVLGFGMGWIVCKLVTLLFRAADRRKTNSFFTGAQIFGAACMAFMHGAQDGQKFMGVILLSLLLANGQPTSVSVEMPVWLMLLCSVVMGLGTSIGGKKIIKSVGMDMVKLEKYQGFSADIAASICLLISSVFGIPVSTTHAKTTAIMGVGAVKRISAINFSVVKEMGMTWILTFPGCGLIGFIMTKLFMAIF